MVYKTWDAANLDGKQHVGVIGDGYPEDGKTIFQDIGASKAPQSDCPAAPAGSPSDCSTRPAARPAAS